MNGFYRYDSNIPQDLRGAVGVAAIGQEAVLDLFPEMICRRVFLGWDQPLLRSVVKHVASSWAQSTTMDLSDWSFVLPTTQAKYRLAELLREHAGHQDAGYVPPQFLTTGDVAETLYEPEKPLAIEFEQTLAWCSALRSLPVQALRPLVPVVPETDAVGAWLELAGTLRRLSTDLASHAVSIAEVIKVTETDSEVERWNLIQRLFESYLQELKRCGVSDPHDQRNRAVRKNRVHAKRRIALIGTSDLNESVAQVVGAVDQEVVALIAAPESQANRFDWLGRFRTESFCQWELPIEDHHLVPASDIADQSAAASEAVAEFASDHPASQITIGTTDSSQVAPIEMQLEGTGWTTYRSAGWRIDETAIGRMLRLLGQCVARPTWKSMAALVRHGDVHDAIQNDLGDEEFLIQLDQLLGHHFPQRLDDPLPPLATDRYPQSIKVRDWVTESLASFLGQTKSKRKEKPIADWCVDLLGWIDSIYAGFTWNDSELGDRVLTREAYAKTKELLVRFSKLNRKLDGPVSASQAIETLSSRLNELRIVPPESPDSIAVRGWLDLALDDSAAIVIVGLNHPFVPSAVTSDPFLPGSFRAKLKLADNDRRFARDAYALQMMLSTRKSIRLVVGKNAADGSPTPPSRLLAAAPAESVARRIRNLLEGQRPKADVIHRWDTPNSQSEIAVPKISVPECPVKSMSVTAFKAYLECPYRFYLRHVLGLRPLDDSSRELAANQFGDLVHGAVEYYGQSDAKDETNEKKIFEALRHHLHVYAKANYGEHVETAVAIQIRQAERRLEFVAAEQAARIGKGWLIHWTEKSVSESDGAGVTVDGKTMGLRGRFDRVDFHPDSGQWAILDYKTHGHKPEKKHLKRDRDSVEMKWIDLQLPLYRLMVKPLGIDVPPQDVQLGYFNVSDKADETKINLAEFSEPMMDQAMEVIEDCVRRIFNCEFDATDQRVIYDDYEMILQSGIASRMLADESALVTGDVQ